MDLPAIDVEVVPEKFENVNVEGPSFPCDLFDTEVVHKIAQALVPGLASACVDNTTGGLFRSPASVAVDIRKEMVEYLTQRSESFVAESVILEGGGDTEVSEHPFDIMSDFVDDFASSKRNLFSRVSGWLLSERREDRIDDFVQEMEINGFWLLDRREAVAQTLLKNVDFKNTFHCNMNFGSAEELDEHSQNCGFRSINCMNEGCNSSFCAAHMEKHDSSCPFKIIPCEQQCSETLMRREMDRHCITVCPMKLVNCPFYSIGCQSTVPHCMVEQHQSDNLDSHMLYALQVTYKDASAEDLKRRVEQLKELSLSELAEAKNVRSLTSKVKNLESTLGPLEVKIPKTENEENTNDENTEVMVTKTENKDNTEVIVLKTEDKENTETDNNENTEVIVPKTENTETDNKENTEVIVHKTENNENTQTDNKEDREVIVPKTENTKIENKEDREVIVPKTENTKIENKGNTQVIILERENKENLEIENKKNTETENKESIEAENKENTETENEESTEKENKENTENENEENPEIENKENTEAVVPKIENKENTEVIVPKTDNKENIETENREDPETTDSVAHIPVEAEH